MITGLELYGLGNKLEMYELTKNTVVLFKNEDLKHKFKKEFEKIKNDETEFDDESVCYSVIENNIQEDHKAELRIVEINGATSIYSVDDEQNFAFTTDADFILKCKTAQDLWFCDINSKGKIELYSFDEFKNFKEMWDKGLNVIRDSFVMGRFDC